MFYNFNAKFAKFAKYHRYAIITLRHLAYFVFKKLQSVARLFMSETSNASR